MKMNKDHVFMMKAAQDAENVDSFGGARVAALVVSKKNIIIGRGYNHSKSNPFAAKYGKNPNAIFFHAENPCHLQGSPQGPISGRRCHHIHMSLEEGSSYGRHTMGDSQAMLWLHAGNQ